MKAIACSIMCMGMWIACAIHTPKGDGLSFSAGWVLVWAIATVVFLVIGG